MTSSTPITRRRFRPRRGDVPRDLGAAVTVALVSIAEGMAYALVAGVDPIYGLWAGSVTVVVGSLFASTTLLMITATNALALVAADKVGALRADLDHTQAMFTLTLLVGVVMLILGLLKLGSLTRFISAEIQAGLVAAVALLILLGQYKDLVGWSSELDANKVRKAIDITVHIGDWNWPTVAVGVGCILVLVLIKATPLRPYADIFALVLGTIAVAALHLDSVETVKDIADIPAGLASIPTPHLPDLSLAPALVPAAIAAAIVGLSEAATVGAAYPNPDGSKSDISRDFVAQGAANIVGGIFRTTPVGGSLSRTGVNVSAGARSRWSGVYAGILLVVLVAVAGGLAELIPLCTLAAILIVIGFETLVREVRHLVEARFVSWPHLIAAAITVLVGLFFDLTVAIFTGVALSLLLYTLTMADQLKIYALEQVTPGIWREMPAPARLEPGKVTVLELSGSAYYASTYRISESLPSNDVVGAGLVLQVRNRRFYSLTGVDYVRDGLRTFREHGTIVVLSDVDPSQRDVLDKTGIIALLGEDNIVWHDPVIGRAATEAYRRAVEQVAAAHPGGAAAEAGPSPGAPPP